MLSISDVETGGREARLDLLFSPVSFKEPYRLYHKPDVETAYWRPPKAGEEHIICVGGNSYKGDQPEGYAQKLVWHELSHALWTERNLKAVNTELEKIGAQFSLFNLLEDARVEERFRRETQLRFEWTIYEEATRDSDADSLLFRLIQLEGDYDAFYADMPADVARKGDDIVGYWERIVACRVTRDLYPILRDWLKQFPNSLGFDRQDGLSTSMVLSSMPISAATDGATEVGEPKDPKGVEGGAGKGGTAHKPDAEVVAGTLAHFLDPESVNAADRIDPNAVRKLIDALRRGLISNASGSRYTDTPSRRIKPQRAVTGKSPYRVVDDSRRGRAGRRKVSMVLDCSGSMYRAMPGGRMLASAISRLARDGEVEGYLILTKGHYDEGIIHTTLKWPVADATLSEIAADGYIEGLENAIRSNREMLSGHTTLVYSDGCIEDDPIQPGSLLGLNVMGVYCSDAGGAQGEEGLRQYFQSVIARDTVEDIACSLAQELRRL